MFVLSVGMPKSGSSLFSNYQKEIITFSFKDNGQEHLRRMTKEGLINGAGHFIQDFNSLEELEILVSLSEKTGPFVVKTHTPLTEGLAERIKNKQIIVTLIHRDPRDVILSAIDHGKRVSDKPGDKFFQQFRSVADTIPTVRTWSRTALDWIGSGNAVVFKYHDLLMNPVAEISHFCKMIDKTPDGQIVNGLIDEFTKNPEKGVMQYNTGKLSRFREEMSPGEIRLCNQALSEEISKLGY